MRITINRSKMLYLLVIAFMGGLTILLVSLFANGRTYAMHTANRHLYGSSAVESFGLIEDRNGVMLADTKNKKRVYSSDQGIRRALLQTIGDTSFYISSGVHNTFKSELTGFNMIWGINSAASGSKSNLKLTLDAKLCKTALNALEGQKGTVGVYNYKTGEVFVMVSSPTYDISNKPSDINTDKSRKYDGVYLNKLLSGVYVPGSVFKTVTAAAAIENIPDVMTRKFNCAGQYKAPDGGVIKCMGTHGTISFEKALNVSCNSAFAQLAIEIGKEKLQKTAEKMGLTQSFVCDRVNTAKGNVDLSEAGPASLGWAGIGQHTILVSPVAVMRMMGAIANGGKAVNPYFVESVIQNDGTVLYKGGSRSEKLLNVTTANTLKSLLRSNVKNYYGDSRFKGLELCAKTGTAEVGGEKSPHAWFAGFSQREDFPYAFVCIVENGGSGSGTAAPIISRVLREMDKTY